MKKGGGVYILTNKHHTTLYTGVTSDLWKRLNDHISGIRPGSFTSKYNVNKLVYFELFHSIEEAILREKQIKTGSRQKKIDLINTFNQTWRDLYEDVAKW